jgi:hypothetical protein
LSKLFFQKYFVSTGRKDNNGAVMQIQPSEVSLIGQWIYRGGRAAADPTCERIQSLIKSHLVGIGGDASGWNTLYRDPSDGRFWILTYPKGELHGGGPPALLNVTLLEAQQKYGAVVTEK